MGDEMTVCSVCGSRLSPGMAESACPACLLKRGLESNTLASAGMATGRSAWVPPTPAELAARFPGLEINELIGRGGMGAVYKARQTSLDRVVALKILPPEIGREADFTQRFAREAQAMAKLNHPHIVAIYDFGHADDLFYLLMEFVDGPSLRQILNTGGVSANEALVVVPQICEALQFAHDHGIVHRDIKPENILLNRKGQVKIADFGLAKLIGQMREVPDERPGESVSASSGVEQRTAGADQAGDCTAPGKILGTPRYMAPEQKSHCDSVDHRADIYSLGVVFYEMLTGELPGKQIIPPSQKIAIDVRLDDIVLRALEKQPEQRYQHASEIKTQVATVAGQSGETARGSPSNDSNRPTGGAILECDQVSISGPPGPTREVKALVLGIATSLLGLAVLYLFFLRITPALFQKCHAEVWPQKGLATKIAGWSWSIFLALHSSGWERAAPAIVTLFGCLSMWWLAGNRGVRRFAMALLAGVVLVSGVITSVLVVGMRGITPQTPVASQTLLAIEKALSGPTTPSQRRKLRVQLETTERRELFRGPRITINAARMPASTVLRDVCREAGVSYRLWPVSSHDELSAIPASLAEDQQPFWKVMGTLADQTGFSPLLNGGDRWQMGMVIARNGIFGRSVPISYSHGEAVILSQFLEKQGIGFNAVGAGATAMGMRLELYLLVPPGSGPIVAFGTPVITRLSNWRGVSVHPIPFSYNVALMSSRPSWGCVPTSSFHFNPDLGPRLSLLKGYVWVQVAADPASIVFKIFHGRPQTRYFDGFRVTVEHVREFGGQWYVTYIVREPGKFSQRSVNLMNNVFNELTTWGQVQAFDTHGQKLVLVSHGPGVSGYTDGNLAFRGGRPSTIVFRAYRNQFATKVPFTFHNIPLTINRELNSN